MWWSCSVLVGTSSAACGRFDMSTRFPGCVRHRQGRTLADVAWHGVYLYQYVPRRWLLVWPKLTYPIDECGWWTRLSHVERLMLPH